MTRAILPRRARGDPGSGSVWVACLLSVVAAVAFAATAAASVAAEHARAVTAADLAALRAADVVQHLGSRGQACAAAARVAVANRARLTDCTVRGEDVTVSVVLASRAPSGLRARATAQAGPAAGGAQDNGA